MGPLTVGPAPHVLDQAPFPTGAFAKWVEGPACPPPFPMQVMAVLTQESWVGSLGLWWTGPEVPSVGGPGPSTWAVRWKVRVLGSWPPLPGLLGWLWHLALLAMA